MVVGLLFALLGWRLVSLQVLNTERGYEFLQDQGAARHLRVAEIPAWRGVIADRHGQPLAVSTPVVSLWADPRRLNGSERIAELAAALGVPAADLRDRLQRYRDKGFMYLRRHMVPARAREVLQLRIAGVQGSREYQRYYPAGDVAAHLVGFTNVDDQGIEGMELAYDKWLRGTPGRKQVIKDLRGDVVREVGELDAANPGRDLTLSIDLRLQYLAHRELQRAVALTGARGGSVVTLDSRTGEVLAMANHPAYNPNNRRDVRPGQTRNRALIDTFEPGSTMKPLTVIAALESGLYSADSVIDTAPGWIRVGSKTLVDPRNYGELDVATILAKSSQVGITRIALQLEENAVWSVFSRFGLGVAPGTGFPGESAGVLRHRDRWRPIERVTLAFGYGLTVSPLQLAQAYAALADEGRLRPAALLRQRPEDLTSQQVLEPALARQIVELMQGVTAEGGTARLARVEGYSVAGKTGTAHKVAASGGGYAEDRYLALFAGVAPVSSPRLVTVVLIDEPEGDFYHGGQVAAPVFSRITAGALRLLNVAPDQPAGAAS
jgi:cell division protein FtsI (penicillin-binding protein 3)